MNHSSRSCHRPASSPIRTVGSALFALALLFAGASSGGAQSVQERTPNLSGGWVGQPGSAHFHLLHRFWMVNGNVLNSPTMLIAFPLPGRTVIGVRYGSNSGIGGEANEAEPFLRWATPRPGSLPVEPAVSGAYNSAARSLDGELSLAVPLDRGRLLGSARVFSDADGSGEAGWALAGGATFDLTENMAIAADYGAAWVGGDRAQAVWGVGIHLRIPTTPHTLSLQATNTATTTLQGSSFLGRRGKPVWGFEFTIPITFARYR